MPDCLFIRADASASIGTGHVMRMIALAQAYQDRGGEVTIARASCPEGVAERIRREGTGLDSITDARPGSTADLEQTIACARALGSRWVVLDGYHFDAAYQRALRAAGFRVLAVDDYGHCDTWAADAVLNQNILAPELKYRSEVKDCRYLLGTRFALLRREFRTEAESLRVSPETDVARAMPHAARRLLVTLGGTDPENVTGRLLAALDLIAEFEFEIKLLVGAGNPNLENLRQLASTSPHSVQVLQNVLDMPLLYRWAEGVISAGGSTCWEWLFYRLPAAVVCLADNQRPVIAGLIKHGLAVDLGWHADLQPECTTLKLRHWLDHADLTAVACQNWVDGLGADRVASMLDNTSTWLNRARAEDARLWFVWANDPAVRANGFHPDPIPWETHLEWFERHRRSPDSRLWIGFNLDNQPLGYVRLHRRDGGEWEVGVAVAPEHRGQGVGLRLVQLALKQFSSECRSLTLSNTGEPCDRVEVIVARIKPLNVSSLNLFRTLRFQADAARSTADCCVLTHKLAK